MNEGLWIFVFLNAFIHTVMYSYFAITAYGVPYPMGAKSVITLMQVSGRARIPPAPRGGGGGGSVAHARRAIFPLTATRPCADLPILLGLHGGVPVQEYPVLPR